MYASNHGCTRTRLSILQYTFEKIILNRCIIKYGMQYRGENDVHLTRVVCSNLNHISQMTNAGVVRGAISTVASLSRSIAGRKSMNSMRPSISYEMVQET